MCQGKRYQVILQNSVLIAQFNSEEGLFCGNFHELVCRAGSTLSHERNSCHSDSIDTIWKAMISDNPPSILHRATNGSSSRGVNMFMH